MQAGCAERVTRSGKLGLGIALGLTLCGQAVGAEANLSGEYGPLTVIVTGNTITGTFFDGRGKPGHSGIPPFTCIFLLKGRLRRTGADPDLGAGWLRSDSW